MKATYFILILLISYSSNAQPNLVLNPSFEKGGHKGYGAQEVKGDGKVLSDWRSPIRHFPDLYMIPRKTVPAAVSGSNAVGLILGSGSHKKTKYEYITGTLSAPLVKDEAYCICFNLILQRTSKWAATDIGILLHHDKKVISDISDPTSMSATLYANGGNPITNTKWNRYCGYYVASGGEQYISFGKFGTSESIALKDLGIEPYFEMDGFQSKAYYLIDDFSVQEKSPETDCGCAEELPEPILPEQESKHPPYLFALDGSGSMKREGLFDSLRQNLVRFVDDLPNGTPVSFVTFASSSRKIFTGIVNPNTSNTVDSLLSRASIGGGTNVFVGLQLAYESWDEEGPDSAKMVLISDGEFQVTPKMVELIKSNYETEGRKLTLIQIGARASGLRELEPYMDAYIHTTQSELSQVVTQLKNGAIKTGAVAVNCECEEAFSDTMNYHFVIDYSGSMRDEKTRANMALRYLFSKAPENAMISITSFNTHAQQLYVGRKSDISMGELSLLLGTSFTGGGTDPSPGVKNALELAQSMSQDRFSHIILITDLTAAKLSMYIDLGNTIKRKSEIFDLAACAISVDDAGVVTVNSQFNLNTKSFVGVSRAKFEKDLFYTQRSSCDYTSQPYHYNPTKAAMKAGTKRVGGRILRQVVESSIGL